MFKNLKRAVSLIIIFAFTFIFCIFLSSCKNSQVDLCEYDIKAEYEQGELTGTVDFVYVNNTGDEISTIKFNLYGNAYRRDAKYKPVSTLYEKSAYYQGLSYGSMGVTSVTGNVKDYFITGLDENILQVNFEKPVSHREKTEICIEYFLKLANVNHRTGITQHTVNLGNFYPILCVYENGQFYECEYYFNGDPFYSECANYNVELKVDGQYVVASSGVQKESHIDGNKTTYKMSLESARDFALVLSTEFNIVKQVSNGVELSYYFYNDENIQQNMKVIVDSFNYFNNTFGNYPYLTLSVVQTGFCYGGMEYPTLTMISDECNGEDALTTIVHENAHQWWYSVVGNNQLESSFLDEGLTEFSTVMFFNDAEEYNIKGQTRIDNAIKSYKAYFSIYNQIFGEVDTTMNRKVNEYLSEYEYSNISYNKGILLFNSVYQLLGEDKFKNSLRNYYESYSYKVSTVEGLIDCFKSQNKEVKSIFESYINGSVVI